MKTVGKYFKTEREEKGLSAREVAKRAGISDAHLLYIENEQRKPTFGVAMKIIKALNADAREFLRETGYLPNNVEPSTHKELKQVPMIPWVIASRWEHVCDSLQAGDADDWIETDVRGRNNFALRVKGNYMEPEFNEGEIIVVSPHIEAKPNDYVIIKNKDNGEATFRQLKKYGETTVLHPLNPKYPDIELKKGKKYEVVGKVMKKEKKYYVMERGVPVEELRISEQAPEYSISETTKEIINQQGIHAKNILNDLTAREWIAETVSVWIQRGLGAGHEDAQIEKQHPAPFSFTDVSRLIRFFTKSGQVVLDPFVGVGSTLKACAIEGRKGIGFELNPRYADLAKERLQKEVRTLFSRICPQEIHCGDARALIKTLKENSVDFVVTSPPYWNILHKQDHKVKQERLSKNLDTKYSDDKLDLGNIPNYKSFLEELTKILGGCAIALKPKKYMAVIVSDFRQKSKYVMFHAHLAEALEEYGLELRGNKILYQRHKKIYPYGYPFAYVPNIHHQYILILQNTKR